MWAQNKHDTHFAGTPNYHFRQQRNENKWWRRRAFENRKVIKNKFIISADNLNSI